MRVLCVILASLAVSACTASSGPSNTDADMKAIAALRDGYSAAFGAEDPDKTAALFATDALYMGDKAQQVTGRDKIRDHYRGIMAGMDCEVQLKAEETVVNGDWGFERGQTWLHIMSKDPKSTLPMIMDQGKYLAVFRKQADGGWLLSRLMTNTNIGPPPPPAATVSK